MQSKMPMRAGLVALALAFAVPASAEEGMWTLDNVPTARMRSEIGWAPDTDWLTRVRAGAARLQNGCSGAQMSSEGLLLTNHHCIVSCVRNLPRRKSRRSKRPQRRRRSYSKALTTIQSPIAANKSAAPMRT